MNTNEKGIASMGQPSQVEENSEEFGAGSMAAPASTGKNQESIVKQFAMLLGTRSASPTQALPSAKTKDMMALISPTVANQDVVLILPTLDLRVEEDPLPKVGEHRPQTMTEVPEGEPSVPPESRPMMEASVLSVPAEAEEATTKEQKEAQTLKEETQWTKSTLVYASGAVSTNLVNSFSTRVDSRVRAWTLLLLKHSLSTGDSESRSRLLRILAAIIKVNSADTTFKTLSLPDAASGKPNDDEVILPLLFEAVLNITIQGRPETVTLRAPGTISAKFSSNLLSKVEIRLDTRLMLNAMSEQARVVVFKAVASATKTPLPPGADTTLKASSVKEEMPSRPTTLLNASTLAGFKSAMNLTPSVADKSPRLQKARSSALRLNGVLHGKAVEREAPDLGVRKIRSVMWDSPVTMPKLNLTAALAPSPKKMRVAQNVAKLKSFKSFGRAHAGDFGSGPRNATFGEYGGRQQPFWGRDGRLANHPTARQGDDTGDQLGMQATAEKNATFDFLRVRRPPAIAVTGSLPRTATALESWLVDKSTNGGTSSCI